jgi:hypothetical protein
MKRFALLSLVVIALAAVPVAFGDDGNGSTPTGQPTTTTTAPATTSQQSGARGAIGVGMRLEILRLRFRIVELRWALHCGPRGNAPADKCTAFAQRVEDRLTTLDGKVQAKIADLQSCTPDSTDAKCKNADKKIALLQKVDTRLQAAIQKVQDWLNGHSSPSSGGSSDSALDQAAQDLGQVAGSNG